MVHTTEMAGPDVSSARPARRAATPSGTSSGRSDWLAARNAWTGSVVLTAALLGAFVCLVSAVFRTEIFASDPYGYVEAAREFPDDSWVPLGYTRYGMVLPRVLTSWVFGNSTAAYYFWPILSAGLLAAGVYLIGFRYWGRVIGGLAVVLAFSSTMTFINLSRGYPDIQSTAIFALTLVLALATRDRLHSRGRAGWWWWLSIGFLLCWGFETRETLALTWPVVVVALWTRAVRFRGVLLIVAGIAIWAAADIAIGFWGYGNPLEKLLILDQNLSTTTNVGDQAARAALVGQDRWYFFSYPPLTLMDQPGGGWTVLLGALALVGLAFRGGARFVSLWFVVAYVGFVGITGGFFPDRPSGRVDIQRYWISFFVPAGLAAAGVVAEVGARAVRLLARWRGVSASLRTRRVVTVVLAVLVALGPMITLVDFAAGNKQLAVNGADQLSQLRGYLAAQNVRDGRLVTDFATARLLPIYQHGPLGGPPLWSAQILDLRTTPRPVSGDLVLINSRQSSSCYFCRRHVEPWYRRYGPIPADWQLIWTSEAGNSFLYRVP